MSAARDAYKVPAWTRASGAVFPDTLLAVFFLWFSTLEYIRRQEADAIAQRAGDNLNMSRTLGEHLQRTLSDIALPSEVLAGELRTEGLAGTDLRAFHDGIGGL